MQNYLQIVFANNFDNSVSDEWAIQLDGSTDDLVFKSEGAGGTDRIRFLDNGGICFGTDTATANALDDYEEGTFTFGTTTNSGSVTLAGAYDTGGYTKIGRLVHVSAYLAVGSISSPSGSFFLTASFKVTQPPLAPGTAPLIIIRPRSGSVFTTLKF